MNNEDVTYAVAYCRYSSNNQREESIDAQLRAIREYAKANHIVILKEYVDSAVSATGSADRKQFNQMLQDSKKKEFTNVIVHKLDRFCRDQDDAYGYKLELKKNGVRVISVLERIDNTPEGKLLEGILDTLAGFYSKNLARETMKGMKENAYKSKYNGSVPPFGYKLIPRTDEYGKVLYSNRRGTVLHDLTLDEKNSVAVKKIFDMVLERKTYPEIIQYLKENNYKTYNGKDFTSESLLDILRNERYTGTYIFNQYGKTIGKNGKPSKVKNKPEDVIRNDNAIPAIISKEQFNDVQRLLDSRVKKSYSNKIEEYLLSGKIICGECLNNYVGERKKKKNADGVYYRTYYRCKGNRVENKKIIKSNCHNSCIRRDEIESFVLKQISNLIFSDKNFERIFEYYDNFKKNLFESENSTLAIKKELDKIERKIANLYDAMADMGYRVELKDQIVAYEKTRDGLTKQLLEIEALKPPKINKDRLKAAYDNLKKLLESKELDKTKDLIDVFVNKVVVYRDNVEVYLNVLPALFCENYGLDIDKNDLKAGKEDEQCSSSFQSLCEIKKNEHQEVFTEVLGSGERIRTFDLVVNSHLLHR